MTTSQIITSIFEFLVLVTLIVGFKYEHKIVEFEKKIFKKLGVKK